MSLLWFKFEKRNYIFIYNIENGQYLCYITREVRLLKKKLSFHVSNLPYQMFFHFLSRSMDFSPWYP